jgi:cation:H+ antiporter
MLAALRGERDIAVGNAVGSSIFNILSVLGLSAAAAPAELTIAADVLRFDLPVMVGATLICLPIFFTHNRITRKDGALLLGLYVGYTTYLVMDATGDAALGTYGKIMGGIVLPLVVVVLVVAAWRHWRRRAASEP